MSAAWLLAVASRLVRDVGDLITGASRTRQRVPARPVPRPLPLTPEGLAPIEGVVDHVSPVALGIRTDDGLYRFIRGFDGSVAVGHHLFSDVDPEEAERAWQAWLSRVFEAS